MIWLFIVAAICYLMVLLEFVSRVYIVFTVEGRRPLWATPVWYVGYISLLCGIIWANLRHYGLI